MPFTYLTLITLLCFTIPTIAQHPSKADTVLYLFFNSTDGEKSFYDGFTPDLTKYAGGAYVFNKYNLNNDAPLSFYFLKDTKPDSTKASKIKSIQVVSFDQLAKFIIANFPQYRSGYAGIPYFIKLKTIYIVEPAKRRKWVYLTRVYYGYVVNEVIYD